MYYEHRYEEARRSFDVSYELASGFKDDLQLLQVEANLTEVCLAENRLAEARTYAGCDSGVSSGSGTAAAEGSAGFGRVCCKTVTT